MDSRLPMTNIEGPASLDKQLDNWAFMIERGQADADDLPWIAKEVARSC